MIRDLVEKNRSYRIFKAQPAVTPALLEDWADLARLTASGGNLQPLAYRLSADAETNAKIFPCLRWAGYLGDWAGPAPAERPTGYAVILRNNEITTNYIVDHGIAAETMRLGAIEKGFGSCILGSIDRPKLREALAIPSTFEILIIVAFGAPGEQIRLEPMKGTDVRYWRDDQGVLHVPKRALKDIVLK